MLVHRISLVRRLEFKIFYHIRIFLSFTLILKFTYELNPDYISIKTSN